MLNRIKKIKHKFYLILSAVILVLSTVSAVGFFTTKQVNSNFIHFQSIDEAAFEATDVEANLLKARINALTYRTNRDPQFFNRAIESLKLAQQEAQRQALKSTDNERKGRFEKVTSQLESYITNLTEVSQLMRERDASVLELVSFQKQIETKISRRLSESEVLSKQRLEVSRAAMVFKALTQEATEYLLTNNEQDYEQFQDQLSQWKSDLSKLSFASQEQLIELTEGFAHSLSQVCQHDSDSKRSLGST
ncbi:hypothetical protein [Vibrio harveyi]|uniref:hypothetical protein n=1 Tax=Vibrio harveyi TaxID=669 RepID=UPI000A4A7E01|nr:hypothetical protein [Vibrio harveyi]